ncbi:hypothetical protein BH09MYX1_BH09MYX1_13170 [soil metagenome]
MPNASKPGDACGELIRSIDWSKSAIGPRDKWPVSLRTILGTMLRSRHPMFLWWGPDLVQFYNDAYVPSFGVGKHPLAMGQRGVECWGEIWPIIGPQIDDVMKRGIASWNEDALVPIFRNGRIEEVYWTYGYSPVAGDDGESIVGTLVVCTETTTRVILERRLQILRQLADALATCEDSTSILATTTKVLATASMDLPFALFYGPTGKLAATVTSAEAALDAVDAEALRRLATQAEGPASLDGLLQIKGPWPEPPTTVLSVERARSNGVVVFGLSARLPLDLPYRQLMVDVVAQIDRATARIDATRARLAVEADRRNLLLQAPIATALVTGPDHRFELANTRYVEMVGREVVGKTYAEAFPEVVGTPLYDLIDRVYTSGEPFSASEYGVKLVRDGKEEEIFLRFSLEPVRDGSGTVYGMMAVALEITDQVAQRRSLERTNKERTELVAQLEAAARTKDEFLATVSHELRTPLNAILGWAQLLRAGSVAEDKIDRAFDSIERNSLLQVQLIEDLLDVSRIVSGKLRLDVELLHVGSVIEAAIDSMQPALEAKGIQFHSSVDPKAGTIRGDGHRMQQVIWNLLSNATKFTPKGGEVRLVAERVEANVVVTVSDTGQGIAKELVPSIFERFEQADGSAARVHGGLGLGLAISRHLVELHGGTMAVESEGPGRGAAFSFSIPVAAALPHPSSPLQPTDASALRDPPTALQGLTVLLIEDEADTREVLTELLRKLGASVLPAASAKEGLALLDGASPRVIVCDIGMPEMDGYELIENVRKRPAERGGRTVALALTAHASAGDRRRALRAGFQMHLAKPVVPAELVAVLTYLAELALAAR